MIINYKFLWFWFLKWFFKALSKTIWDCLFKAHKKYFYALAIVCLATIHFIIGSDTTYNSYSPEPNNKLKIYERVYSLSKVSSSHIFDQIYAQSVKIHLYNPHNKLQLTTGVTYTYLNSWHYIFVTYPFCAIRAPKPKHIVFISFDKTLFWIQ